MEHIRKNYRNMTEVERDRFIQSLYHVKSTGVVEEFAALHDRLFNRGIHRTSHFLPWHRELLRRFEAALQTHHADITIPYWDSTMDRSSSDPLWRQEFLGQFNSAWGLGRAFGGAVLPTLQQVETNQRRETYDAFWPELEGPIHGPPHVWVGGVMASRDSPGDPAFYLHHCWIDLLWARWQRTHPGAPFVSSGKRRGLNDSLPGWPSRTPADVLDHRALGYIYDFEPDAGFVSQSVPSGMQPGRSYEVTVIMRNTGAIDWTAGGANPFRLGSQGPQDNQTWGRNRVNVPGTIAPGEEAVFRFNIDTPNTSGVYTFQWRMVHEQVEWFGAFTRLLRLRVLAPNLVLVPYVREIGPAQADAIIRAAGLVPRFVGSGTWVWRQSPEAETPVPPGTTVTMELRSGEIL